MRWTSFFTFLSIAALAAAVISQIVGWTDGRAWFLLAWTVLLLPVTIGLFAHPMRAPAWGLFIGFWGVVAVLALIVLQALAVAGVIGGSIDSQLTAGGLALIGLWILVASGLGFGAEGIPRLIDLLGLLTGAGLILVSVTTVASSAYALRAAALFAAAAYILWGAGLAWLFFGLRRTSRSFRSVAVETRA